MKTLVGAAAILAFASYGFAVPPTPADKPNTTVERDGTGSFSTFTLNLDGNLTMPNTSASGGVLFIGGASFLHAFGLGNTYVGRGAGNLTSSSVGNAGFGTAALGQVTTGGENAALGFFALSSNTEGNHNAAGGFGALSANTTGLENAAFGWRAMFSNTTGTFNTAVGAGALSSSTEGYDNTAIGWNALRSATTVGTFSASDDTAVGTAALEFDTSGADNTAVGFSALIANTVGSNEVAMGDFALRDNTTGDFNTATGSNAMVSNITGTSNVAVGAFALDANTTGGGNIAIGSGAGAFLTTGDDNIDIGNIGVAAEAATIRIGFETTPAAPANGGQSRTFIAGIKGAAIAAGIPVVIDPTTSQLGVVPSSIRFKTEVHDMGEASNAVLKLRPVVFKYKPEIDPKGTLQYGLIAEEVASIAPDLVAYGADGKVQTVRYQQLDAMLVNELQKARARSDEQADRLRSLEREIAALRDELARQKTGSSAP